MNTQSKELKQMLDTIRDLKSKTSDLSSLTPQPSEILAKEAEQKVVLQKLNELKEKRAELERIRLSKAELMRVQKITLESKLHSKEISDYDDEEILNYIGGELGYSKKTYLTAVRSLEELRKSIFKLLNIYNLTSITNNNIIYKESILNFFRQVELLKLHANIKDEKKLSEEKLDNKLKKEKQEIDLLLSMQKELIGISGKINQLESRVNKVKKTPNTDDKLLNKLEDELSKLNNLIDKSKKI